MSLPKGMKIDVCLKPIRQQSAKIDISRSWYLDGQANILHGKL